MAIDQVELGLRLKRAREAAGLTQDEVAGEMNLSRPTIAQIELGNRSVTGIELGRLAFLYGREVREFLAEEFSEDDLINVLLRSDDDEGGSIRKALRDCIALGHELSNLEALLGLSRSSATVPAYPSKSLNSKWDAIQSGTQAAQEERRRLGLGISPVGDAVAVLEAHGIRTGVISMPPGVSGLMLSHPKLGLFVVVNRDHPAVRQRFSWCHEYAHLLLDRAQMGHVSREADRASLLEVRANVFAACFLMPEEGVRQFVALLGKGGASRIHADVFDEVDAVPIDTRVTAGTQELQLYDIIQLAHHFGVSVLSALYRLRNLRLISEPKFEELQQQDKNGNSQRLADMLGLPEIAVVDQVAEFHRRYLILAFEAYRRDLISRAKLIEIARKFGVSTNTVDELLQGLRLTDTETVDALLPTEA